MIRPFFILLVVSVNTENTTAITTESAPNIECFEGFKYDVVAESCADVDECALARSPCESYQHCQNTIGSFECKCFDGYKTAPFGGCEEKTRCERNGQGEIVKIKTNK